MGHKKTRTVELASIPVGVGCVLPSGRKATVTAPKKFGNVKVIAEGERLGIAMILRGSLPVYRLAGDRSPNF